MPRRHFSTSVISRVGSLFGSLIGAIAIAEADDRSGTIRVEKVRALAELLTAFERTD